MTMAKITTVENKLITFGSLSLHSASHSARPLSMSREQQVEHRDDGAFELRPTADVLESSG